MFPECQVLQEVLGLKRIPCKPCIAKHFPSYYKKNSGIQFMGCWIAHTALAYYELKRCRRCIERILNKLGISWNALELLVLLHDAGKLSEKYGFSNIQHNILSAVISIKCLEDSKILNKRERYAVSLAIALHHEAYHWREVCRYNLHFASSIKIQPFTLRKNYQQALICLSKIVSKIQCSEEVLEILTRIKPTYSRADVETVKINLIPLKNLRPLAIPLYWLLFLADNRAASARNGVEKYWRNILNRLSEDIRKNPEKLGKELFSKLSHGYIALSLLC